MKIKFEKISYIFSVVICCLMMAAALFLAKQPKKELIETTGIIDHFDCEYDIIDEEYDYTTYVDYEVNGVKYDDVVYGAYSSSMKEGDEVVVLYDVNNPEYIESPSAKYVPYIVAGAAWVFLGVSTFIYLRGKKNESKA